MGTSDGTAVELAARAIADAQNVPFVGPKQTKLATAALEAAGPAVRLQVIREMVDEMEFAGEVPYAILEAVTSKAYSWGEEGLEDPEWRIPRTADLERAGEIIDELYPALRKLILAELYDKVWKDKSLKGLQKTLVGTWLTQQ